MAEDSSYGISMSSSSVDSPHAVSSVSNDYDSCVGTESLVLEMVFSLSQTSKVRVMYSSPLLGCDLVLGELILHDTPFSDCSPSSKSLLGTERLLTSPVKSTVSGFQSASALCAAYLHSALTTYKESQNWDSNQIVAAFNSMDE